MNKIKFEDIVLALAGIDQTAVLIQQIATTGNCDPIAYAHSIKSVYMIDTPDAQSVFGGPAGAKLGIVHLHNTLFSQPSNVFEKQIYRHVLSMIQAERALQRDPAMLTNLQKKIRYVQNQAEFFSPTHPSVIASLAKIYVETIGTLAFKIGVIGKKEYMNTPEVMQKIRALLLAGVRSAVLWRQVGGNRLQLLFKRKQYRKALDKLFKQVQ